MKIIIFIAFICILNAQMLIKPIPEKVDVNIEKAKLGKLLFFDTNFSKDKKVSCASCHNPDYGWADKRKVSIGVFGRKGTIQSPTCLNSRFNFRQFWNGRAKDLVGQIDGPIHAHVEMDFSNKEVEKYINSNNLYKKLFKKVYKTNYVTYNMFKDAIAEFEKALITPNCKFDLYLKGKTKLTPLEKKGYILFKQYGCITCHNGVNVGGNSYQKMGLIKGQKKRCNDRYEITHNPLDKYVFKVPSLRNIELTAPYFHDARAKTLEEAIDIMADENLGLNIDKEDAKAIIAFLKTLTGEQPAIMKGE